MGKRGPKSNAPGGYGTISAKGHRRVWDPEQRRIRMEHVLVWERVHGPVQKGLCVHHVNLDKLDNRIENLELVDSLTHKRIHSGCEIRDGEWWKPCCNCGEWHPVADHYRRRDGISPWCRACCIANADKNYRLRRASMHASNG